MQSQGDTIGFHCRITWNCDGMKSVNLFLHLDKLDNTKSDKSAVATAEKLVEFLYDTMDLGDLLEHFCFTSDYAIYRDIFGPLEKLGPDLKIVNTVSIF